MATLDCSNPAPRVNAQQLSQFVGKRVTLVGRIEGVEGNTLQLRTPDNGVIAVQLQNMAPQVRRRREWVLRSRPNCCRLAVGAAAAAVWQVDHCFSDSWTSCMPLPAPLLQSPLPPARPQVSLLEVQGLVNSPTSVTEETLTPLSDNFGESWPGERGS